MTFLDIAFTYWLGNILMAIKNPRIGLNFEKDACPCGSGIVIRDCCLRPDGRLIPKRVSLPFPNSPTNYAHPKCYCRILNDCDTKISTEHFVSEGILRSI